MRYLMTLFLAAGLAVCASTPAGTDVAPKIDRIAPVKVEQLSPPPRTHLLVGARLQYAVQAGDLLTKIGARQGVSAEVLARDNGLRLDALLKPGQELWINNRHIVPNVDGDGLYINLPQRMLYYFQPGELLTAYPVGIGKPDWPTPTGQFTLIEKVRDKTWIVPESIQEEMRREGRMVKTSVPPGPDNPLGKYWLGLSIPSLGIHGTNAPNSVYKFQSHGCIRLHPDDIEALFAKVKRGVTGRIIYEPVLLAEADGRIYLEVNRDVYRKGGVSFEALNRMAGDYGVAERMDWLLAADVLASAEGVARDVTLHRD